MTKGRVNIVAESENLAALEGISTVSPPVEPVASLAVADVTSRKRKSSSIEEQNDLS